MLTVTVNILTVTVDKCMTLTSGLKSLAGTAQHCFLLPHLLSHVLPLRYHPCHLPRPHSRNSCSARPTRISHPWNMLYLQRRGPTRKSPPRLKVSLWANGVFVSSRVVCVLNRMCLSPSLCHSSHTNLTVGDWESRNRPCF